MCHVIFADDVWLFASSRGELIDLLERATPQLRSWGLEWKRDEKMTYAANSLADDDDEGPLELPHLGITATRAHIVEVLGNHLDINGDPWPQLWKRAADGRKHFYGRAKQLRVRTIPLKARLGRYVSTVRRTFLYSACCFSYTQALARYGRRFEALCFYRLSNIRRYPDETTVEHYKRLVRICRYNMHQMGCEDILRAALREQHRWAGHLARSDCDAKHIAYWRCGSWWTKFSRHMRRVDWHQRTTLWKHSRPGTHTRWCGLLDKHLGEDWWTLAQDRDAWKGIEDGFVQAAYAGLIPDRLDQEAIEDE